MTDLGRAERVGPRQVVVLAPMPLEMDAIVFAFGLSRTSDIPASPATGHVGTSNVTAVHIGMGPTSARAATSSLFDQTDPGPVPVDHVMIAGICGGLDPSLDVGTLINPETVVDHTSGLAYRHTPPGNAPRYGKLLTTEGVNFEPELSIRWWHEGYIGVDMESAAVAEVCAERRCPWSVYRCISDRHFDGLLDERIVAMTNPDGSGNLAEIEQLLAAEPELATALERLAHDTTLAARLAAEAAVRGCLALEA
jgi:nucleoside phosphorylase